MAAPPITSVGWCARRCTRLAATAAAKPTLAAVWASESARTKAVQKAASVCPLGKLLLEGVRTVGVEVVVGPLSLHRGLHDPAHDERGEPGRGERHHGAPAVRAAASGLDGGERDPDEPVVGQV